MADYIWRGLEQESLERARIEVGGDIRASSVVDSARGRYSYELICTRAWVFRELRLEALTGHRVLEIVSDGAGAWNVDGLDRGDLADAIDLDLPLTPLTKTLAIRRLRLEVDEESDLEVASIDPVDLEVFVDRQRLTRLAQDRYLVESLESDEESEVTVDAAGVVLDQPGAFERL